MVRYPKGTTVGPGECNLDRLKKDYGGKLPCISGKKCKYPSCDDEAAWAVLYSKALTYRNKERYCRTNGLEPPLCPQKYKYEYILFHGRPSKKKDRSARNRDRRLHGLKKGDKMVVHHTDPSDMSTKKTVKLTHCQHQKAHGKKCKKQK